MRVSALSAAKGYVLINEEGKYLVQVHPAVAKVSPRTGEFGTSIDKACFFDTMSKLEDEASRLGYELVPCAVVGTQYNRVKIVLIGLPEDRVVLIPMSEFKNVTVPTPRIIGVDWLEQQIKGPSKFVNVHFFDGNGYAIIKDVLKDALYAIR